MKAIIKSFFAFLLVFNLQTGFTQTIRYAATVSPGLQPPYALYLEDYVSLDKLRIRIRFNDYNESFWRFKLRIKIQSHDADITLETSPGFQPPKPLIVAPGENFIVRNWELRPYLNFENLTISGSGGAQMRQTGRLPEGLYNFCVEILDYNGNEPLSPAGCTSAWLQLMNAPQLLTPTCGAYLDPRESQIAFVWQLFNAQSPNDLTGTTYTLRIWELLQRGANPQIAVQNGDAIQIYSSDRISGTSLPYDNTKPPLEDGKTYIYQVQAFDSDGKDVFKNNGLSEFCYFHYGWPTGGIIDLVEPVQGTLLSRDQIPKLKWSVPDNLLDGQGASYEVEVMERGQRESLEEAYSSKRWVHSRHVPISYDRFPKIDTFSHVKPMLPYIWKVSAYTNLIKVAESPIGSFYGPRLMDYFYAGRHKILVDELESPDLTSLRGRGRVRLSPDSGHWTAINFSELRVDKKGDQFFLERGSIFIPEPAEIKLTPDDTLNMEGIFFADTYKLDRDGLSIHGKFSMQLPFPTTDREIPAIESRNRWFYFDDFQIFGGHQIGLEREVTLLEPFGFTLKIDSSSSVYIQKNNFRIEVNGKILSNEKLKNYFEQPVEFPFYRQKQLQLISEEGRESSYASTIKISKNTGFFISPKTYTIDLSSNQQAGSYDLTTGVYLSEFALLPERNLDSDGKIVIDTTSPIDVLNAAACTAEGLTTTFTISTNIDCSIHTFISSLDLINLTIENNEILEPSYISGDLLIPFFSEDSSFDFSSRITVDGFDIPVLANLEGRKFTHNPGGGEQEISIAVKEAFFGNSDYLNFILDLDWPALNVQLNDVRGFRIWGDHSIGFAAKNGTAALVDQVNTKIKGYPATIARIGAGSNEGYYSLATQVKMVLGEDVSGTDGPPTVNFYSLERNSFVPEGATGEISELTNTSILEEIESRERETYREEERNISSQLQSSQDQMSSQIAYLQSQYQQKKDITINFSVDAETPENGKHEFSQDTSREYNARQIELLHEIIEGLVTEITVQLLHPAEKPLDELQKQVNEKILSLLSKGDSLLSANIESIITAVVEPLRDKLQNDKVEVNPIIDAIASATHESVLQELMIPLHRSVHEQLLNPFNLLIQQNIKSRLRNHIIRHSSRGLYKKFEGKDQASKASFDSLYQQFPELMENMMNDVADFAHPSNIEKIISSMVAQTLSEMDPAGISSAIRIQVEQSIRVELNKALNEAISNALQNAGDNLGMGVVAEAPIDFVGVGTRLAEGDLKGALAIDPVPLKVRTPIVDLEGYVQFIPDDPVYGNVWSGDIDMHVKVPSTFAINATFMNGRVDQMPYWFIQISPPSENGEPFSPGQPLPKRARPIPQPVDLGVMSLVGASGRLYHKMSEREDGVIVPDPGMRYGAFMNLIFFDKKEEGQKMRLEVLGEVNTRSNGDFSLAFQGYLNMENNSIKVLESDPSAAVIGEVSIAYNSAEKHFLGYAAVTLSKPGQICGQGSLLVDVKPSTWRIAIGSREERVVFIPGCQGWAPTGWLDLNQEMAELGLGLQWSIQGTFPKDDMEMIISGYAASFDVNAGLAAGVMAAVQYRPFQLQKAGIWADLWATVIMHHGLVFQSKRKTTEVANILLKGDLTLYFVPKPSVLKGNLRGYVSILFFNKEINASLEKVI